VYIKAFTFRIGEAVTFYGEQAIILDRTLTAQGRELYQVWIESGHAGRPFRCVLGRALEACREPSHPQPSQAGFSEPEAGMRNLLPPKDALKFEIGQPVTLKCGRELAIVTGRKQTAGCVDEYAIELVDTDAGPLWVFEFQIEAA
jgi:hypothetical protein